MISQIMIDRTQLYYRLFISLYVKMYRLKDVELNEDEKWGK